MTFPEDELPTRPTSQAQRATELVRLWAKLSKANQSLVLSLVKALLGLALISCTSTMVTPAVPREAAATVVMLSATDGHPCCSGVSVLDARGRVVLLTAGHCVTHKIDPDDVAPDAERTAHVGDVLRYVAHDRTAEATLIEYDPVRDRAELEPNEREAPLPLAARRLCDHCALDDLPVHAVSALYGETRSGRITGKTFAGASSHFWESDMSIVPGWSGSPVLNDAGQVVGIVAKCNGTTVNAGDHVIKTCTPSWSIFTDAL